MPAGTSWPRYIAAVSAMMLSMFAGAQTVHFFYNPLDDLSSRIESEKEKLQLMQKKDDKTRLPPQVNAPPVPSPAST